MASNLDEFVAQFQQEVFEETKQAYGEEAFRRWLQPEFFGAMPDCSGSARITGPCGESMEIYLKIEGDAVAAASFFTDGCGASIACGSLAADLAHGKSLEEAASISGDAILEKLGGLPEDHRHCAQLAAETLQAAVHNHLINSSGKSGQ